MNTVLAILFSGLAGSHGWGMRGTHLGHGKGALLPGLLIGFGAAAATGSPKIIALAWIVAAFGAVGMFPGGGMSYGQTVSLVIHREATVRGTLGFALKGFLWFGVAAGFISVGIMSLGLKAYTLADILLLFAVLVLARPLGIRLFNRGKNKLYFSKTRKESWGENLVILAALVCVFLVNGDFFSLTVTLIAGLFGAAGWVIGIWGYRLGEDGILFRRLRGRNMLNGWKFMEFALGAMGGVGTALGVVAARKLFPEVLESGWFVSDAGLSGYVPQSTSLLLGLGWCALCVGLTVFCLLTAKTPWGEDAEDWLLDIVYCAVPFLFLALGSYHTALFLALPVLLYLLIEEFTVDKKYGTKKALSCAVFALCALLLALQAVFTTAIPVAVILFFNMLAYYGVDIALMLKKKNPDRKFPECYGSHFSNIVWFGISGLLSVAVYIFMV